MLNSFDQRQKTLEPYTLARVNLAPDQSKFQKRKDMEAADEVIPVIPKIETAELIRLLVYADVSLTKALTKIAVMYRETAPNINVEFRFEASGALSTLVKQGAACDIFISACRKKMNELDITSADNTTHLDFIFPETRFDLVGNKIALVVPAGNPAGVTCFDDLIDDKVSAIAIGNSDITIGHHSKEILIKMNCWDAVQRKLKLTADTGQIAAWVAKGNVDCGILFASDASSAGLKVIAFVSEDLHSSAVIFPAAVLKISGYVSEAKDFLDFLKTDASAAVFKSEGFFIP